MSEVAQLLFAIDLAVETARPGTPERRAARKAQVLVTARLWPGVGEKRAALGASWSTMLWWACGTHAGDGDDGGLG